MVSPVPDLFDLLHGLAAHFGERRLRQPRREADAQGTRRELHQRPALVDGSAGQERRDQAWELALGGCLEQLDHLAEAGQILLLAMMRPDQRDGFAEIADIVVAEPE
jgi:hypothetical protein